MELIICLVLALILLGLITFTVWSTKCNEHFVAKNIEKQYLMELFKAKQQNEMQGLINKELGPTWRPDPLIARQRSG